MKAPKKELVHALLTALAPHLPPGKSTGQKPPKGMLKTIRHLADQLLRARAKQEKRAAAQVPKEARQQLAGQLTAVLDAHFAQEPLAAKESQLLSQTAEELAGKLTKLRRKQAPAPETPVARPAVTSPAAKQAGRRPPKPTSPNPDRPPS